MSLFLTAAFALLITTLCIPLVIVIAKRFNLVDDPNLRPHPAHVHTKVVPRAGGLAIYIGIIVASMVFLQAEKYLIGIFAGITLLVIMGLIDDKLPRFNPYWRLILLFAAAGLAVGAGIGISFINNPFGGILHLDQIIIPFNIWGPHKIILLADLLALFWIVTVTQIVNWSKGVDGQMPGITLIAAIVLGLLSYKFYLQGDIQQLNNAKLAFIVAGSALGFLIFNWHPAKIFPGFAGSTILAYMLAVLAILSTAKIATALLVLGIPTVDFIYTFFRRILSGKSPVWADRGHLHHKLLDLGWSQQKISLFYILGSGILGGIALFISTESKLIAGVLVAALFLGFILWLNYCGDSSRPSGQDNG